MTIKILLEELVNVLGLEKAEDLELQVNNTYSDVGITIVDFPFFMIFRNLIKAYFLIEPYLIH